MRSPHGLSSARLRSGRNCSTDQQIFPVCDTRRPSSQVGGSGVVGREAFYPVKQIPVVELFLDTKNPRIREGKDQRDCLERLLSLESTHMLRLARDIGEKGLSPEHIVVSKDTERNWVVRDGNRRIAAMKLLLEPDLCPYERLRRALRAIGNNNTIPKSVDCLACDNERELLSYIDRKHSGENNGVGQKSWTSITKSYFARNNNLPDPNSRALAIATWAEARGMSIHEKFPITTLTRLLMNQDTLRALGFEPKGDSLVPVDDEADVARMVKRILQDLSEGTIKVNDVFTPNDQISYANKVRSETIGVAVPQKPPLDPSSNASKASPSSNGRSGSAAPRVLPPPSVRTTPATRRPRSPTKPSWNRTCLFPGKSVMVPTSVPTKVGNVVAELKQLRVDQTPIAVAVLFRVLIEMSTEHYLTRNGLVSKGALHRDVAACAEHMATTGTMSADERDAVRAHSQQSDDILNVRSLQRYVHSTNFAPLCRL